MWCSMERLEEIFFQLNYVSNYYVPYSLHTMQNQESMDTTLAEGTLKNTEAGVNKTQILFILLIFLSIISYI